MKILLSSATVVFLLITAPATARCVAGDRTGSWAVFVYGSSTLLPEMGDTIDGCTVLMNSQGGFRRGSVCANSNLTGRLNINTSCTMSGVITVRVPDDPTLNFSCGVVAAMTRDHEAVSGVMACDNDFIFMLNRPFLCAVRSDQTTSRV